MHGSIRKRPTADADDLAEQIAREWRNAAASIIHTGRLLIEAKKRVGHGKWTNFVAKLPFRDRTASCLMAIARHPIISNPQHVADLPPSWGTLHRLTYLPDRELKKLIAKRKITPETERGDVDKLIAEVHAGGLYRLERLAEAVKVLADFAKGYPDPKEISQAIYLDHLSEGVHAVGLSGLARLPAWLTKLHSACKEADERIGEDLERTSANQISSSPNKNKEKEETHDPRYVRLTRKRRSTPEGLHEQ
jgi:hypothetical protein